MRTPKAENRNNEIAKLSAGLMELAHELNVPLLAASQLNRSVEGRHDKRPTLADLRDSGAIEQDAHVCMFIHRESYYARRDPALNYNASAPDEAEIIVSKNRCGRTGISKLAFRQDITTFYNIRHDDAWSGA
jgi:replicative DNA helicase